MAQYYKQDIESGYNRSVYRSWIKMIEEKVTNALNLVISSLNEGSQIQLTLLAVLMTPWN